MILFTTEELNMAVNKAVDATKTEAIKVLSLVLENWVHGGNADCIIAEFEEKLNNEM